LTSSSAKRLKVQDIQIRNTFQQLFAIARDLISNKPVVGTDITVKPLAF
jgi:hypothetical protein